MARVISAIKPIVREAPDANDQANLPGLANAVTRVHEADGLSTRVYVAASAVFNEARFRGDSWATGLGPEDGYFFHPESPLCRGVRDFPPNTTVAVLYPQSGVGIDESHTAAIELAWRKYAKRYGAELVRFADDAKLATLAQTQYVTDVTLDPNGPFDLYVAATKGSRSLSVALGTRRTGGEGVEILTRNEALQLMASRTQGLTLLVDHSPSMVRTRDDQGKFTKDVARQQEFEVLRSKLCVLLKNADANFINVIGFGVNSGEGAVDAVFEEMQPATAEGRSAAVNGLRKLVMGEGTPALRAMQLALADSRCTRIVLVTDGLPDSQSDVLDWLARARQTRDFEIHTIGVGDMTRGGGFDSEVDWPVMEFLQALAAENQGTFAAWDEKPSGGI